MQSSVDAPSQLAQHAADARSAVAGASQTSSVLAPRHQQQEQQHQQQEQQQQHQQQQRQHQQQQQQQHGAPSSYAQQLQQQHVEHQVRLAKAGLAAWTPQASQSPAPRGASSSAQAARQASSSPSSGLAASAQQQRQPARELLSAAQLQFARRATSSSRKKRKNKIPRPMNSFMCFARRYRPKLQQENPGLDNKDVSRMLGVKWRNLSDEERTVYTEQARLLAQEHRALYPEWKFTRETKKKKKKEAEAAAAQQQQQWSPSSSSVSSSSLAPARKAAAKSTTRDGRQQQRQQQKQRPENGKTRSSPSSSVVKQAGASSMGGNMAMETGAVDGSMPPMQPYMTLPPGSVPPSHTPEAYMSPYGGAPPPYPHAPGGVTGPPGQYAYGYGASVPPEMAQDPRYMPPHASSPVSSAMYFGLPSAHMTGAVYADPAMTNPYMASAQRGMTPPPPYRGPPAFDQACRIVHGYTVYPTS